MRSKNGFTLIELLITITIMAVLLTLTVVSLRSSQAHARDEERRTDVSIIAQALESYHSAGAGNATARSPRAPIATLASVGMPEVKLAAAGNYLYVKGYYPPTSYFTNETAIRGALPSIDPNALRAPGVAESASPSLVGATSTSVPSPSVGAYIYQPLKADGSLCTLGATSTTSLDKCTKFSLYYQLETVSGVQTITSKHQ